MKKRKVWKLLSSELTKTEFFMEEIFKVMRRSKKKLYPYFVDLQDPDLHVLLSSEKLRGKQPYAKALEILWR